MSIKRRRGGRSSSEWLRKVNQEDLLAEIAERLQLELNRTGMTIEAFSKRLGQTPDHVAELLDGLVNISVRELADIFSIFDKIVALNLIGQNTSTEAVIKQVVVQQVNHRRPLHTMNISYTFKDSMSILHRHDFVFVDEAMGNKLNQLSVGADLFGAIDGTNDFLNLDLEQEWGVVHEF